METFLWSMHRVETHYPTTGFSVQFGNAYRFTAAPDAPDQRTFSLKFTGFKYFSPTDDTTNANINNMLALEKFYQRHRLHKSFIYPHPVHGNIVCRFAEPLKIPDGIPGGNGVVNGFEVTLVEVP